MRVDLPALGRPTTAIRIGRSTASDGSSGAIPHLAVCRHLGLARQGGAQRLVEVRQAFAMLRGNCDRLAETERERLGHVSATRPPFGLVGNHDDRLARPPQHAGEHFVCRQYAGAGIDEEEHRVRRRNGGFGLRPHAARQGFRLGFFQARGVDDGEGEVAEVGGALAPVAGDARGVVDQREPPAGEPVEQRRFSDIRPADNRDGEAHWFPSPLREGIGDGGRRMGAELCLGAHHPPPLPPQGRREKKELSSKTMILQNARKPLRAASQRATVPELAGHVACGWEGQGRGRRLGL